HSVWDQTPEKLQVPTSKLEARAAVWSLELGISLVFGAWFLLFRFRDFSGAWCLGFGVSSSPPARSRLDAGEVHCEDQERHQPEIEPGHCPALFGSHLKITRFLRGPPAEQEENPRQGQDQNQQQHKVESDQQQRAN